MCSLLTNKFVNSLCRHDVSITVTSISSRERPRARGAGAPPMVGGSGGPQSSPKTHTRVGSGPQQQYNTAAASSATVRSTPQQASGYMRRGQGSHLNPPSALYRNSRSLDSGLDEFGAVPFAVSPPSPQTRPPVHAAAQTQMQATQVSKDHRMCHFVFLFMNSVMLAHGHYDTLVLH